MAKSSPPVLSGYFGVGIYTKGEIRATGVLRVDGVHEGELDAPEGRVSVGEGGRLVLERGTVEGLVLQGRCIGKLTARQGVEIIAPGECEGSIDAGWLDVEEGAILEGTVLVRGEA